ncbi:hypothetical protein F4W67_23840 [Pseudomonas caricapapayae]|nr:hypothetical protein F4W67_23840 [Pseudomonas caricapapayae]
MNDLLKSMQRLCQLSFAGGQGFAIDSSAYFCTALRRAAQKQGGPALMTTHEPDYNHKIKQHRH